MSGVKAELLVHIASKREDWDQSQFSENLNPLINLSFGQQVPSPANFQVLVAGRPSLTMLSASANFSHLVIPWAGLPKITLERMANFPGVSIHNLHHNAQVTAEMAMALLLAAARRVVPMDKALRRGDWRPRYQGPHGIQLHGQRALILGFGHVGKRVARMCHCFGMEVKALRRSVNQIQVRQGIEVHPWSDLEHLLKDAQILILCAPLTAETENVINKDRFGLLPKQGILINVGRGELVDQWALHKALTSGQLGAAGSDVWYQYPEEEEGRVNTMPSQAPLWELDNFVLSPHRAGMVTSTSRLRTAALASLLNSFAEGIFSENQVDLELGY